MCRLAVAANKEQPRQAFLRNGMHLGLGNTIGQKGNLRVLNIEVNRKLLGYKIPFGS